jgi:O-acetyl-ADP-ribose deacetylase (regulator of RNase III)
MITYTTGNLLDADVDAVVNTVNTVGVMGKGIALMFKEAFPENFKSYEAACRDKRVQLGKMFVTERRDLLGGPRWIINFPTKAHWRFPSKLEWIREGLQDLRAVILERKIRSIAIPPLGSGNGGLDWREVKALVVQELSELRGVEIIVYEPTSKYQNVAKREGVETLTPARALVAELIRRYMVLGLECTLLEIHKLAYFLEYKIESLLPDNPLKLEFKAHRYGPYAPKLTHLLDALDGSYLHCEKRLGDASPLDLIWFEDAKRERLATYLATEGKAYLQALDATSAEIDGFESPLGMELLATVHWLLERGDTEATVEDVRRGLKEWPGGSASGTRKMKLFNDRLVTLALERLRPDDHVAQS